jgi:hypothetical protein
MEAYGVYANLPNTKAEKLLAASSGSWYIKQGSF